MSKKLENVTYLYMKGIRDGKIREAFTEYAGIRYIQHSTGVKERQEVKSLSLTVN